jgi:hypothetical protein
MKIFNIFKYLLFNITTIISLNIQNNIYLFKKYSSSNLLNTDLFLYKLDDIQRTSLLSKLIYDINYPYPIQNIYKYSNFNLIDINYLNSNKILFKDQSFFEKLNKDIFLNNDKYNNIYNNIDIFGYFNYDRIYSLLLVDHTRNQINIIFRGSNYIDEWINNINIFETKIDFTDNFFIHQGIYHNYKKNEENMDFILNIIFKNYPNYKKIFSGHSKGCINSLLTAYKHLLNDKNNNKNYYIYLFGNPPIFNYNIAKELNKNLNIYNIINNNDIVCKLPYKYHVGKEIIINNNNINIIEHKNPYKLDNLCFTKICDGIIDHDMKCYINNLYSIKK